MRIVIHDYAGHAFSIALSRALAARGHQVVYAYASSVQAPQGELRCRPEDSPTLEFRELPMDPDYPRYKYSFVRRRNIEVKYGQEVGRFIRDWKPDAVLSGNTPTETQEPITRATVETGGRFYYWIQDFYSLAVDKILRRKIPFAGGWVGAWYRRLDRRQFERSSRLVAITDDFTPILAEEFGIGPERVEVVPNWADIEQLPARPKDNPWSRRHGLHDKFVFLYSGTIGLKHNPQLLLDLANQYRSQPDVQMVVISEGIGADWLRKESAGAGLENLTILPYQPFAELPDALATGDVLLGLLEEDAGIFSVPSKTLSYLCAGRSLLLSVPTANLAARITRDNGAGLTVPPGDSEAFLAAAEELRSSAENRDRFAGNARAYAERTFPIDRTATTFERILSSAA